MTERRLKRQFGAKASTTWIQKRLGIEGWLRRVDRGWVAAGIKSASRLVAGLLPADRVRLLQEVSPRPLLSANGPAEFFYNEP